MCMAPKAPTVTQTVTPPPAEAPQPLASPYGTDEAMTLSALRIGSRNNLRSRPGPTGASSGLTIGSASSSGSSSSGTASAGGSTGRVTSRTAAA
jgi:hypothetical protein